MSRKIDLAGQRFDRLVVVAEAEPRRTPSGQLKVYWSCRCDCGGLTEVLSQNLRERRVRSCGCLSADSARERAEDLSGRRFGRLVPISRGETLADGSTTWRCACDCGAEKTVRTHLLKRGEVVNGSLLAFSTDADRYSPRCTRCHRRYDIAQRDGGAA